MAWLGWGFDVFDGLLFIYVAPSCIPTLLGLPIGSPQAKAATLAWTGALTSLLLIGWALGGILFGWLAQNIDKIHILGKRLAGSNTVARIPGGLHLPDNVLNGCLVFGHKGFLPLRNLDEGQYFGPLLI